MDKWNDILSLFDQFGLPAFLLVITILLVYMYFQLKHVNKLLKEANENNFFAFLKRNSDRFKKAAIRLIPFFAKRFYKFF